MNNVVALPLASKSTAITTGSKAYVRWLDRVQNGPNVWTENEIKYLRRAVGTAGLKSAKERAFLRRAFADKAYDGVLSITMHHSIKGQQYLLTKSLKIDGSKRKGCRLGDRELSILKHLDHHLIVGLERPGHAEYFLPIYRAVASNGQSFDYVGHYYEMVQVLA